LSFTFHHSSFSNTNKPNSFILTNISLPKSNLISFDDAITVSFKSSKYIKPINVFILSFTFHHPIKLPVELYTFKPDESILTYVVSLTGN
jgi:hypothetical protein